MKGKVLGFSADAGTGAIAGDDGKRYAFSVADWQGGQPVDPGARVDFEAEGQVARGIYAETGGAGIDMGAIAASPAAGKAKSLLTGTIAVPIAIVALLACVMPALSMPQKSVSLLDLPSILTILNPFGALGGGDEGAGGPSAGFKLLLMLRFAAPLLSALVLWQAWRGGALRMVTLAAGAASILAFLLVMLVKTGITSQGGMFGEAIGSALSTGFGAWLLLLCGIGLILAGLGKITSPFKA
ncbi:MULTISPECIES: hypothetical protein [unclassified Sphingomonas]|uniref:hypothetical protein n=1 Tax=unclassified Sphingomonas TaxID=196159 RepID=UPI00092B2F68|nr:MULTISPECIES: hypothetical protein [unclassified Sphingomonas]MBN8847148.1 hypothetical protein [Sphingomonas sp.]OJV32606.1 MAG: hypothetical protein BGO24_02350 [Sphingomonas sp. 67-36]